MHYKNGRRVNLGDWVVGRTHNSKGEAVCGIVIEIMPDRGNCNIKIHSWRDDQDYNEGVPEELVPAHESRGFVDYGDAKEFVRVDDGLRMISAVLDHGNWDGPYL